jgi:S-adenosyl methyltransferase
MTSRGPRTPDVGRIYDALLCGKDNFAEDRQAAARLIAANPDVVVGARANREFPGRAVRFLAAQAGIGQFLGHRPGRVPHRGRHHPVLRRPGDGPAGAVRRRGLTCRTGAGTGRVLFLGGIGRKQ